MLLNYYKYYFLCWFVQLFNSFCFAWIYYFHRPKSASVSCTCWMDWREVSTEAVPQIVADFYYL